MDLWPDQTLRGLSPGVPFPERGPRSGKVRPDRITLLQQPLAALDRTPEELKDVGRETVMHEVGHYFGRDDARLAALMEP
jgi:predicted Zn-dependent protease with MMP-like domain